jgi:hypothetical protein
MLTASAFHDYEPDFCAAHLLFIELKIVMSHFTPPQKFTISSLSTSTVMYIWLSITFYHANTRTLTKTQSSFVITLIAPKISFRAKENRHLWRNEWRALCSLCNSHKFPPINESKAKYQNKRRNIYIPSNANEKRQKIFTIKKKMRYRTENENDSLHFFSFAAHRKYSRYLVASPTNTN